MVPAGAFVGGAAGGLGGSGFFTVYEGTVIFVFALDAVSGADITVLALLATTTGTGAAGGGAGCFSAGGGVGFAVAAGAVFSSVLG